MSDERQDPLRQVRVGARGRDKPEQRRVLLAFGENLRSARVAAGLSQERLAARCFMRRYEISGLELGGATPSLFALQLLAHGLDVPVARLTDGLVAPTREVGRGQVLALIARQPDIAPEALASSLRLPNFYVYEIVRYLASSGEIVPGSPGWRHALEQTHSVAGSY